LEGTFEAYVHELDLLRESVKGEIAQEEQRQNSLLAYDERLHSTGLFILSAILLNLLFLIVLPRYMLYWIISSFMLYMLNPFILMIPTDRQKASVPDRNTIREFMGMIRDIGGTPYTFTEQKKTFGKVLWDAFFINSQPLAVGFGLIFGADILFAIFSGYITGTLESGAAALIILQSLAIILFYAGIWQVKPYSTNFFLSLNGMRVNVQEKIRRGWRAAMRVILLIALMGALSGILVVSAMLLPGMTLSRFLISIDLSLGWSFLPIALIFLSQIIVVRYLQGTYSRELLLQVGDYKIHVWQDVVLRRLDAFPRLPETVTEQEYLDGLMSELESLRSDYLRMRVYKPEYHDLFGLFPVYLVMPDFHLIMDWNTVVAPRHAPGSGKTAYLESVDQNAG
jgi:hypothetical protein